MIKVRSKLLRVYIATQLLYKCLARELFMRRKLTFKRGGGKGGGKGKKLSHISYFFLSKSDSIILNIIRLI